MHCLHALLLLPIALASLPARGDDVPEDHAMHTHMQTDEAINSWVGLNQLETRRVDAETSIAWEVRGWIGTDLTRLWLRSDGERIHGRTANADVQLLLGRSISPWWDMVAGIRHDSAPGKAQTFGAIGIQGLAPMRVDVAMTAYVSSNGHINARLEFEHDLPFTQRLFLQSRLEMNLYGDSDVARQRASGLSAAMAGLRLRYEVTRQFAPYLGLQGEQAFGKTATLWRSAARDPAQLQLVAGVRAWL